MQSEARQKKIMEKFNRTQKWSISGPQNLGLRGAAALDPHLSVCVDDWTARSAIIASNGNDHRGRSSQSMISKY